MSNVNATNYAKSIMSGSGSSADIVDPGVLGGKVRVMIDEYEASSLAAGSYILVGKKLQSGARILDILLAFDALGGSTTLSVGDEGSDQRYLVSAATTSAGMLSMTEDSTIGGLHYEVTGTTDNVVRIAMGGAAGTGTIKIAIYYTED